MNNISNTYKVVIWNKGDKPEKSTKRPPINDNYPTILIPPKSNSSNINNNNNNNNNNNETSSSHITPTTIYRESNNKRQDSSDKISERYLIEQRGLNPYISHSHSTTSYANDVSFLIPKCSNEHPKNRIEFN